MFAQISVSTFLAKTFALALALVFLALTGCSSKPKSPESAGPASVQQLSSPSAPAATTPSLETTDAPTDRQTTTLALPKNFGRATGDWDQIVKRGAIRVLVINNRTGFFYDKGRPRGANVEFMEEFEIMINRQLKTSAKKFKVVYLPIPPGQLLTALNDGTGDIACTGIIITPEREKLVDFTIPLYNHANSLSLPPRPLLPLTAWKT